MTQDQIDELLIDWELARQAGKPVDASVLCKDMPHLSALLEQKIRVLRSSSWMLQDPAPQPYVDEVNQSLSRLTYNEEQTNETLLSSLLETSAFDPVDIHEESTRVAGTDEQFNIPGFKVDSELGRGGFGVVYHAVDENLQRSVAIKIPLLNDEKSRSRYLTEARNAAKVEVAGIVPVLQVGTTRAGIPFVVQKFIDGKSLAQILKGGQRLSPRQLVALLTDVCQAVGAAHAESLIHRDLKPGNIMVDKNGRPWVTDFGLAVTEDQQLERRGEIAGTPSYMAPEQLQGKVDWCDGRTDIWAIGVILYQCLTGRMPFRGPSRQDLREQIMHQEPRPICQRLPQLPKEWDAVFSRCCAKSITERYSNTFDLAVDLSRIPLPEDETSEVTRLPSNSQSYAPGTVSGSFGSTIAQTKSLSSPRSYVGLVSAAALLLLAISTAGLFWMDFTGSSPAESSNEDSSSQENMTIVVDSSGATEGSVPDLSAALDSAPVNAEIVLMPGSYKQNLVISKKVSIRGHDKDNYVSLTGVNGPVCMVKGQGDLALRYVQLECESDTPCNTVEVEAGRLKLTDCEIIGGGFNGLHLVDGSSLDAEDCRFVATEDHAIFAKECSSIEVSKSNFALMPDATAGSIAGIQLIECGGSVSVCSFVGEGLGSRTWGIEARECDALKMTACTFRGLQLGIRADNCTDVQVGGSVTSEFADCTKGMDINATSGTVKNCNIGGSRREATTGIQIVENDPDANKRLTLENIRIENRMSGLIVVRAKATAKLLDVSDAGDVGISVSGEDAELTVKAGSRIANCSAYGLLLQGGKASLTGTTVENNSICGVIVNSLGDALKVNSSWLRANPVGMIVLSGEATLESTEILESETGVVLARKHQLYQQPSFASPPRLTARTNCSISSSKDSVRFLSPGSYSIEDCPQLEDNPPTWSENLEAVPQEDGSVKIQEIRKSTPAI